MRKSIFARWRACFFTGFVVTLPAIISIAALLWVFRTVSNLTDLLLFFLPKTVSHEEGGAGPIYWYWSLVAFMLAVILISVVGVLARYYIGKRMIEWMDNAMMQVPLLNKFYGAIKQVNEAFAGNKHSFKTVVLVQFPREGMYSVGFITSEQHDEVQARLREKVLCVFVPTTPNPTSGFLILVPETQIIKLEMSVADAIKYIISLGSISQEYAPHPHETHKTLHRG
ncbi:MAG: DUF502 domain-containing protein [Verrucomicrobiia bacterium]